MEATTPKKALINPELVRFIICFAGALVITAIFVGLVFWLFTYPVWCVSMVGGAVVFFISIACLAENISVG